MKQLHKHCDSVSSAQTCIPEGPITSKAPIMSETKCTTLVKLSSPMLHEPSMRKTTSALAPLQTEAEREKRQKSAGPRARRRAATETASAHGIISELERIKDSQLKATQQKETNDVMEPRTIIMGFTELKKQATFGLQKDLNVFLSHQNALNNLCLM